MASWEPIGGAARAVVAVREAGDAVRFLANTTSRTRTSIADTLRDAGIEVDDREIATAASATAAHLRHEHPDRRVLLLNDGPTDDLGDISVVGTEGDPEVVVLGGAGRMFT